MQSCHANDLKSGPRSDKDVNVKDEHEELNKIISGKVEVRETVLQFFSLKNYFLNFYHLAALLGKWDPSSSIKHQAHAPAVEGDCFLGRDELGDWD